MNDWSRRMREHRKRSGLSQKRLAAKCGISENSISYYERGEIEPGLYNLVRMADVLGIGLDEYIGREVYQKNKNGSEKI